MFTLSFTQLRSRILMLASATGFALMMAVMPAIADANYSQGSYAYTSSVSNDASRMCHGITRSLSMGSRDASTGNQVSALQKFLAQDRSIYPEGEVTGYFGPQTQKAVQRFQTHYGIVTSGTPDTTGYGSVGAQTRAMFQSLCENADDEDEEEEEKVNDIDSIDEIIVYLDKATKRAEVEVIVNKAPDLSFVHTYVSQAKAVTFIGEKLENSYDFDFDEFSTDRKRDIQLKRLIEWEFEEEDEDEDILTVSDIRRITVTSSDDEYVDVIVDLKDGDDLAFDVSDDSESSLVRSIANKLENSYDFDFDEYSSDRKRDSDIKKLIDWEEDDVVETDSMSINASAYGGCSRGGGCSSYVLEGKNYTYKKGGIFTCLSLDCQKPLGKTGTLSASLYAELMEKLTAAVLALNSKVSHARTAACSSYVDGVDYSYKVTRGGVHYKLDTCNTAFGSNTSLQTTLAKTWTEMEEGAVTPTKSSYGLSDVKSVTSKSVDPIPNAVDDEYTLYTITLKSGTKHEVKVGFTTVEYRNKAFADTGYTGDVTALMALATANPNSVSSFGIDDVKSVTSKYVDPTPVTTSKTGVTTNTFDDEYTVFVITLNSGVKHEVKRYGFGLASTFENAVRATGYTGDVAKLIALAKPVTNDPSMCLSDGSFYKEGTETTKVINSDGTVQGIADGVFICSKGKWVTRGNLVSEQPKTPFNIDDIKTVVSKFVDPSPSKVGDEYTQYDMTLDNGTKRSVDINFGSYAKVESGFKDIGYTGSVWDITIKAAQGTSAKDYGTTVNGRKDSGSATTLSGTPSKTSGSSYSTSSKTIVEMQELLNSLKAQLDTLKSSGN